MIRAELHFEVGGEIVTVEIDLMTADEEDSYVPSSAWSLVRLPDNTVMAGRILVPSSLLRNPAHASVPAKSTALGNG